MAVATSSRSFLQLPYDSELPIHGQGIMITIFEYSWYNKRDGWVPQWIPEELFYYIRSLRPWYAKSQRSCSARKCCSARLAFKAGTPHMWSSLRHLTVKLDPHGLRDWQEVCSKLRAHLPSSQLTVKLHIEEERGVTDRHHDMVASTKEAFSSMLELPVLKRVLFTIEFAGRTLELHRMTTRLLKRLTCPPTERCSPFIPFRFMDLPTEIRYMIIGNMDLIAPGPVVSSKLKGYVLEDCCESECPQRGLCHDSYDSWRNCCWSLPADLFLVNRHISAISSQIFFSRNEFTVNLMHVPTVPAPNNLIWSQTDAGHGPSSPRILGTWYPSHSTFLRAFPPVCIPMLKSVIWRFPMLNRRVLLSRELEADWRHTVNFISQNVQLSKLAIALDMLWNERMPPEHPRTVSRKTVVLPLRKLQDLRDLSVYH